MRPTVLVDCDGVLADFTQAALNHVLDITGNHYKPESITTWEVFDSLPEPKDVQKQVYDRMKAEGGCWAIPVMHGARDGLAAIAEIADVAVVTSPFRGSPTWVHERADWLDRNFPFVEMVIHTRHKHLVHGNVFVDDKDENVAAWLMYWEKHGHYQRFSGIRWRYDGRTTQEERWRKLYQVVREHS